MFLLSIQFPNATARRYLAGAGGANDLGYNFPKFPYLYWMYIPIIWIVLCGAVTLYSYDKILGIVIKKTKFKNQERSMWNHSKNEFVVDTFMNVKQRETDPNIIKEYKRLILMLWLPLAIMGVGLLMMMIFVLVVGINEGLEILFS